MSLSLAAAVVLAAAIVITAPDDDNEDQDDDPPPAVTKRADTGIAGHIVDLQNLDWAARAALTP